MPKLSHFFDRKVLSISFFINNEHPAEQKIYFHATFVKKTGQNWKLSPFLLIYKFRLKTKFLRERGITSNPKMEYQVFSKRTIATVGLKDMGKFLWEGREKGLPCWLSQFSKTKLRRPTGQTFFPTFPKEFSHFLQT